MNDKQETNHALARSRSNAGLGSTLDPLYAEACELVRSTGNTRISHLQRVKRLTYNRAARLMESMEIDGIVSPTDKFGVRTLVMPNV